ncbi:tripartite tricarboxylate transporter substrate binding protein [Belnapia sp. T6]|uniref:Tripartite tricarboxylate transporter substrate binding protein n=1 Tax=Belnapia mucosa TaxID=2804532 RepID=A0ABS1V333_9PROT|nr:tripartite tricarboxylate transporter substrate binding protein [Belnapia mucosa]
MHRRRLLASAPALLSLPLAAPTLAQPAFDHTIRIIVPFAPGGTSDILARILAPELTRQLGQSVVVENRPGAAGNLGADAVAKAAPDGHTILLIDAGILATAPSLYSRLPFDIRRDLAPATMLIYAPYILAVHPSLPAQDAAGLVAFAKANPNRVNVAHSGIGAANHLTALMLAQHWGVEPVFVPYRGGAAALAAAGSGEANLIINGATATQPFVQNGTLRGIAVSGPHRLPPFPALPTFRELGWPAVDSGTWQGVLLPGGTPPAMLARWDEVLRATLAQPEIARRIGDLGGEVRAEGPAAFRAWLDSETESWGTIIRANNVKLD